MQSPGISAGPLILLLLLLPVIVVGAAAQESGSVTRGRTFTVTVVGDLRAPYVVWVAGTHGMSGEPGDQPPVIAPGQSDVMQDSPGGPYAVGSTPIGSGRTVMDDVARSSSVVPNTSYYAQVRTGIDGRGVVLFLTSMGTATQQFHVSAVNPAHPDREVTVILDVPATVPVPTLPVPVSPATSPSPRPVVTVPQGEVLVIPATAPETPVQPPATQLPVAIPETVPSPQSTPNIPVGALTCSIALGTVFFTMARFRSGKG
ncbi:MAG: hypothetical protein LUQ64_03330 [Methanomicrobiales archaeon]|nr:hypothetical protein [Methanomicrobiales archaeon]